MHDWEYFTAISTVCRLLVCAVILTNLVHHCELVYRQTDRIISISDHLLINKNPGKCVLKDLFEGLRPNRPNYLT